MVQLVLEISSQCMFDERVMPCAKSKNLYPPVLPGIVYYYKRQVGKEVSMAEVSIVRFRLAFEGFGR